MHVFPVCEEISKLPGDVIGMETPNSTVTVNPDSPLEITPVSKINIIVLLHAYKCNCIKTTSTQSVQLQISNGFVKHAYVYLWSYAWCIVDEILQYYY